MSARGRVNGCLVRLLSVVAPASLAVDVAVEMQATPTPTAAEPDVIEVYHYRASSPIREYAMENVDTADLYGVLKYIHTEVIAEHTQARPERTLRKYNIDRITQWKIWMRNPKSIVNNPNPSPYHMDFGQYITYDYGQATNLNTRDLLDLYGEFVGVQSQNADKRYATDMPYYWMSLPGFCPNLPYVCTNGWGGQGMTEDRDRCLHDPSIYTSICSPDAPCPSKGSRENPRSTGDAELSCSMNKNTGAYFMGGLCEDPPDPNATARSSFRTHPNTIRDPTGGDGCVYSYDYPNRVEIELDKLVGITQEDCYGGKCADWTEFRRECVNDEYKKIFKFTRDAAGKINNYQVEWVSYCVEYDINPYCEEDCNAPECLALAPEEKELGLPFWKGRCDKQANARRAEALAFAVGIKDAQTNHKITMTPSETRFENNRCDRAEEASIYTCRPNPTSGGPYCSRHWSHICTTCFIPGTKIAFSDETAPICPLDIVKQTEYKRSGCYAGSCCATRNPVDYCCLYYDSCTVKLAQVGAQLDSLPLDEGSLRLVEATKDTDIMLRFLKRLVQEEDDIVTPSRIAEKEEALKDVAYWQWGHSPSKDHPRLRDLKAKLELVFPETSTGAPTVMPTTHSPTPPPGQPTQSPTAPTPAPPPPAKASSGGIGTSPVLVLVIIILGAAIAGGFWQYRQGAGGGPGVGQGVGQQEMAVVC